MDYVVAPLAVFRPLTVPSIRRRWCESPSSFYSSVERDCVCVLRPVGCISQPAGAYIRHRQVERSLSDSEARRAPSPGLDGHSVRARPITGRIPVVTVQETSFGSGPLVVTVRRRVERHQPRGVYAGSCPGAWRRPGCGLLALSWAPVLSWAASSELGSRCS